MSSPPDSSPLVLERLFEVIERRRDERPAGSYVVSLLDGGLSGIGQKVREEAAEVVQAAEREGDAALAGEVADLLFHVLVLLAARGVPPEATYRELGRRFGIGGLVEKASRADGGPVGGKQGAGA